MASRVRKSDTMQPKPRPCRLPECGQVFTPPHIRYDESQFCTPSHRDAYWKVAREIGHRILSGQSVERPGQMFPVVEGRSNPERVLNLLKQFQGQWVDAPRLRLPDVIWNSALSKLRKRGYRIECRRVGQGNYEYRLGSGYWPNGREE